MSILGLSLKRIALMGAGAGLFAVAGLVLLNILSGTLAATMEPAQGFVFSSSHFCF